MDLRAVGQLTLSLAGQTFDLDAGDAVHFDSRLPHRVIARGGADPEILLVASPLALERSSAAAPSYGAAPSTRRRVSAASWRSPRLPELPRIIASFLS